MNESEDLPFDVVEQMAIEVPPKVNHGKRPPGRPKKAKPAPRANPIVQAAEEIAAETQLDSEDAGLAQAFRQIIAARNSAADVKSAKRSVEDMVEVMGRLSDEEFRILAGNSELQEIVNRVARTADLAPGSKIFDERGREMGYVPFSLEDFKKIYPMQTWVPSRSNMCISVNGVSIAVWEGVEVTTPKCFYDVEMEALAMQRRFNPSAVAPASQAAYADGYSEIAPGWRKRSDEELIRTEGIER